MKRPQTNDNQNKVASKRLAKYLALYCVRNTYLEKLHAGTVPDSLSGDRSDVRVVTPTREIPWNSVSRLNDAEMKQLMIEVVNHCYAALLAITDKRKARELFAILSSTDPVPEWYDPSETDGKDVLADLLFRIGRY